MARGPPLLLADSLGLAFLSSPLVVSCTLSHQLPKAVNAEVIEERSELPMTGKSINPRCTWTHTHACMYMVHTHDAGGGPFPFPGGPNFSRHGTPWPACTPAHTALTPGQAQNFWAYSGVVLCLVELFVCRIYGPSALPFLPHPLAHCGGGLVSFLPPLPCRLPPHPTTTPSTRTNPGVDAGSVIPATILVFFIDRFLVGGQLFDQFARVFFPRYKVRVLSCPNQRQQAPFLSCRTAQKQRDGGRQSVGLACPSLPSLALSGVAGRHVQKGAE